MTKFHTDDANIVSDPFDRTETERRIVFTPVSEPKYPSSRALAAAYWISYFTLHWLLLLEIVEPTWQRFGATLYFFLAAALLSVRIAAHSYAEKKHEQL